MTETKIEIKEASNDNSPIAMCTGYLWDGWVE